MVRCIATLLVLVPITLSAAPLKRQRLPQNTRQLVHVDFDQLKKSPWLRSSLKQLVEKNDYVKKIVGRLPKDLSFLSQSKLHDVTVLVGKSQDAITAIISVDTDWAKLQTLIEKEPSYVVVKHGKHSIHHWVYSERKWAERLGLPKKKEEGDTTTHYLTLAKPGLLVVSNRLRSLVESLDTLDGKRDCVSPERFKAAMRYGPKDAFVRVALQTPKQNTGIQLEQIAVWFDEHIHIAGRINAGSEAAAAMYLSLVNESVLTGIIKQFAAQEKKKKAASKSPKKAVKRVIQLSGKPKKKEAGRGRLSISMQFNGHPMKDVKHAVNCILKCVKVERDKSGLVFQWTSYADLNYEFHRVDGIDDHRFLFSVFVKDQKRVASKKKTVK